MVVKKKNITKKKTVSRKQTGVPKKQKPAIFNELKKILVGIAILVSVCLTAAMVADLFFHPGGRTQKNGIAHKPMVPSEIKPVQEDIQEPKEKKQVEGLKEKPEKPSPDKSAGEKPVSDKPIKYEVFEGVDQSIVETPPPKIKDRLPRIAIIIDDIGYDKKIAQEFTELNSNLTFSVLPFSPFGRNISEDLHSKGAELMLHLPMEPSDYPNADPGPGAMLSSMPPDILLEQLKKNIKDVPYIVGVNNHMGSELTTHSDQMNQIFTILKKEKLFFIDSRTSLKSQGRASARLLKLKFAHRDVFLDNNQDVEYVAGQFAQLVSLAKKQGSAIGIGHPYKATLLALSKELPKLKNKVEIVRASELTFIPE
ncbi:MAG: divergent polysaccharide deacetylase family protein [Desulfobacula sp.]|jgi:hypothetical protein